VRSSATYGGSKRGTPGAIQVMLRILRTPDRPWSARLAGQ
jgi:hypothetical protein